LRPEEREAFGFVIPLVLLEVFLVAMPLVLAAYYSMFRVDFFELTEFRGFDNYIKILTSPFILKSLFATLVFSFFALVITLTVGLGLYGRSYTLKNPGSHGLRAPSAGAGQPGQYSDDEGLLSYYEVGKLWIMYIL